MAKQKGIGFCHAANFVRERYGADAWQSVLARLNPDDAREINGISAVAWYDLALYARLLHAIVAVCARGDTAILKVLGRYELARDLNVFLKLMMRAVTPRACMEGAAKLWARVQDTGDIEVELPGPRKIACNVRHWGVVDAFLCIELCGYFEKLIEQTGAQGVQVTHKTCRAQGADVCLFEGVWE